MIFALLAACLNAQDTPTEADTDADADSDADSDTDADSDSDADSDADVDTGFVETDVYGIDLTTGNWTEPPGVGPLVGASLDTRLLITPVTTAPLVMRLAVADGQTVQQDDCIVTVDSASKDFAQSPEFDVDFGNINIDIAGVPLVLRNANISGTLNANNITNAEVFGIVDTRPLVPLVSPGGGDNAVCGLVAAFGVSCQPCPDGSGDFCVPARIEQLTFPLLPNGVIMERTQADVDADPFCF